MERNEKEKSEEKKPPNNPFSALFSSTPDSDTIRGQMNAISPGAPLKAGDEPPVLDLTLEGPAPSSGQPTIVLKENHCFLFNLLLEVFRFSPYRADQVRCEDNGHKHSQTVQRIPLEVALLPDSDRLDPEALGDQLDQLLFERLMMDTDQVRGSLTRIPTLATESKGESLPANEKRQLHYLYHCYYRLNQVKATTNRVKEAKGTFESAIVNQSVSFLSQSEVYPSNGSNQVTYILDLVDDFQDEFNHPEVISQFLSSVVSGLQEKQAEDEDVNLMDILSNGYYKRLSQRFEKVGLIDPSLFRNLEVVRILASTSVLGKAFLDLNSPWKRSTGASSVYDFKTGSSGLSVSDDLLQTLLGRMMSVSCLPRQKNTGLEFFLTPSRYSQTEHQITERNIGVQLKTLMATIHHLFLGLLKQPETRSQVLNWIGLSVYAFKDRSKMWTNEVLMVSGSSLQLSDGFMLNFSNLLLQLCQPFCEPYSPKLLKIDPRYCLSEAMPLNEETGSGIHMRNLADETFVIQAEEGEARGPAPAPSIGFNFMTEIFFATHKALQLGFRSCHERFLRLTSDLGQIQRLHEEAAAQGGQGSDTSDMFTQQMDKGMTQFLSLKAVLSQPDSVELMLNFHLATSTWLTNLAMAPNEEEAGKSFVEVKVTLAADEPDDLNVQALRSIPEFVVENVSDMVSFVRRFSEKTLGLPSINLEPLMTFILVFMGSPNRMRNPHLRARLAEVLEALMPRTDQDPRNPSNFGMFGSFDAGAILFTSHPHVTQLVPTLIHVFVSIEMTGQSVAFEQKFQYRRPMYMVLKYLWQEVPEPHRTRMKQLAAEAEANLEAANAPLFLRFINLLINDAIFLLDESLDCMSKLREMQLKRASPDPRMTQEQRQQEQANYHHLGRLARFHNVMGRDTIHTLAWLTEEVKTIFCQQSMVDRMAAMLNYFLVHLVGPKKKNLKVQDMETYDFKPAEIVHDICVIYINLGSKSNERDKEFCLSIGADGRSYSKELLPLAANVLIKTGKSGGGLSQKVEQLERKIKRLSQKEAETEIPADDVPDEFLDPIMSSLMTDPVLLPSGYTMDRNVIARHLLSEQNDPFTRLPLTMEMMKPNEELKAKIDQFIVEYNEQRKKSVDEVNNQ